MLSWILRAAAVAVPPLAVTFARLAGGSWPVSLGFGALALLAVYLSSRAPTDQEKAAELGRGVVVSVILTIAVSWVQHQGDARTARQNLALTLSSGSTFIGIDLHGRDLKRFYLAGKDLSGADLHGADLERAVLRSAKLRGADLHGRKTDLSHADLGGADLSDPQTNLSHAHLEEADLSTAHFVGAVLFGARLRGADFEGADLRGADLRTADLRSALLAGSDLRGAFLSDADLRGAVLAADLRNARLEGAGLKGARWDAHTRWPPGFDPTREINSAAQPLPPVPVPVDAVADKVAQVVDGDTVVLQKLGGLRLLGIDAPQAEVRPRDCYGLKAATDVARLLPAGERVRFTLGTPPRDKFGRALAYAWLSQGELLNEVIIERGDARPLFPERTPYALRFRAAAVRAEMNHRGLWTCPLP